QSSIQIERRRLQVAAAFAAFGPRRQAMLGVGSGLERRHRCDIGLRRSIFKILIEKWTKDLFAKRQRRIAIELDSPERAAVANLLTVMPWAKDEKHLVVLSILRLDLFVHGDVAVDVFLVPQTVDQHHWNLQRLGRENLVDRLIAPVSVVTRMLEYFAPEAYLFEAAPPPQLTGRAGFHEHVVVVVMAGPPQYFVCARGLLVVDVAHALLAKGAVVEPVVAHPAVDHRIHRH